jgi:ABC-type nickel/cobalt efflux system permease component RcnA
MALMQTFAALGLRTADEASTSEIGPGLTAFAIVVVLAIATFLLLRSMLHHIRKVPPTFDADPTEHDVTHDDDAGGQGSHPDVR